jgi:hypothetical protein
LSFGRPVDPVAIALLLTLLLLAMEWFLYQRGRMP